jgi:tetratricopeptide (TPR) repeat protein
VKKIISLLCVFPIMAFADWQADVSLMQTEWAKIKYETEESKQQSQYDALLTHCNQFLENNPQQAEVLIWHAIIEASYAGSLSAINPTALGYVKNAKKHLEESIKINPEALDGSAYTSLGSLYYQVPGWPLGFGDDDKAEDFLKKGLAINPNGIDPNYFYADFLIRDNRKDEAKKYLNNAKKAKGRPGREVADQGRREEVMALIQKINP